MTLRAPTSPGHRAAPPGPDWRHLYLAGLTAATAYSTALGWQAQVVSYPLFRAVPEEDFVAYHRQYSESIPLVVIAPGVGSFLAGCAFWWTRPAEVPSPAAAVVSVAGVVALASTALWAVPMHDRLQRHGRSEAVIGSLLRANALRTAALTASTLALVRSVWRSVGHTADRPPA